MSNPLKKAQGRGLGASGIGLQKKEKYANLLYT
jgi:hypothetical protein